MRRQVEGSMGARFRNRGIDPEFFLAFAGPTMLFSVTCIAFFLTFASIPLTQLYAASIFSLAAMVIWGFTYRG
jgi:hypothetical protein